MPESPYQYNLYKLNHTRTLTFCTQIQYLTFSLVLLFLFLKRTERVWILHHLIVYWDLCIKYCLLKFFRPSSKSQRLDDKELELSMTECFFLCWISTWDLSRPHWDQILKGIQFKFLVGQVSINNQALFNVRDAWTNYSD